MIVGLPNIIYTIYMENTKEQRDKQARFQKKKQNMLRTNACIAECIEMSKNMAYQIKCYDVYYNKNIEQMSMMYPDIDKKDLDDLVFKLYMVENNWSLEIDI